MSVDKSDQVSRQNGAEVEVPFWTIIGRSCTRRCPRCGTGKMFVKWTRLQDRCEVCDLKMVENQGDPWGFLLFFDRAFFIFPVVVALFFELYKWNFFLFFLYGAVNAGVILYTMPHRYGACVGLDYWMRQRSEKVRKLEEQESSGSG